MWRQTFFGVKIPRKLVGVNGGDLRGRNEEEQLEVRGNVREKRVEKVRRERHRSLTLLFFFGRFERKVSKDIYLIFVDSLGNRYLIDIYWFTSSSLSFHPLHPPWFVGSLMGIDGVSS